MIADSPLFRIWESHNEHARVAARTKLASVGEIQVVCHEEAPLGLSGRPAATFILKRDAFGLWNELPGSTEVVRREPNHGGRGHSLSKRDDVRHLLGLVSGRIFQQPSNVPSTKRGGLDDFLGVEPDALVHSPARPDPVRQTVCILDGDSRLLPLVVQYRVERLWPFVGVGTEVCRSELSHRSKGSKSGALAAVVRPDQSMKGAEVEHRMLNAPVAVHLETLDRFMAHGDASQDKRCRRIASPNHAWRSGLSWGRIRCDETDGHSPTIPPGAPRGTGAHSSGLPRGLGGCPSKRRRALAHSGNRGACELARTPLGDGAVHVAASGLWLA